MTIFLICIFGGLGAASRFVLDGVIRSRRAHKFPVATVIINVSGSLLIGFLAGAHLTGPLSESAYFMAAVGFCGGYTTFSTALVETVRLIQTGDYVRAAGNLFGTLVLAVAAAGLGVGAAWLIWS